MVSDIGVQRAARAPFRVGDWLVEPDLDRISRGEERRTLRPRVTELLVCLAERPGCNACFGGMQETTYPSC